MPRARRPDHAADAGTAEGVDAIGSIIATLRHDQPHRMTNDTVGQPDPLAEHRALGNCPPKDWGFILDDARIERLRELLAGTKPLPAWARRECQRYRISIPRTTPMVA